MSKFIRCENRKSLQIPWLCVVSSDTQTVPMRSSDSDNVVNESGIISLVLGVALNLLLEPLNTSLVSCTVESVTK